MKLDSIQNQIFKAVKSKIEAGLSDDDLDTRSDPVSLVLINNAAYELGFSYDVIPPAVQKLTRPVDELLDEHDYIDLAEQDWQEECIEKGICLTCGGSGKVNHHG